MTYKIVAYRNGVDVGTLPGCADKTPKAWTFKTAKAAAAYCATLNAYAARHATLLLARGSRIEYMVQGVA